MICNITEIGEFYLIYSYHLQVLDISIKWPNDIYANGNQKIGGLVINTTLQGSQAIVNIGSGINLNNSRPTVCINDLIREYNTCVPNNKLPILKYELLIAMIFNEIERLWEKYKTETLIVFMHYTIRYGYTGKFKTFLKYI